MLGRFWSQRKLNKAWACQNPEEALFEAMKAVRSGANLLSSPPQNAKENWFESLVSRWPHESAFWVEGLSQSKSFSALTRTPSSEQYRIGVLLLKHGQTHAFKALSKAGISFSSSNPYTSQLFGYLCTTLPPHFDELAKELPIPASHESRQHCLEEIFEHAPEHAKATEEESLSSQVKRGRQFQTLVEYLDPNLGDILHLWQGLNASARRAHSQGRYLKLAQLPSCWPLLGATGPMWDHVCDYLEQEKMREQVMSHPVYVQIEPSLQSWKTEFEKAELCAALHDSKLLPTRKPSRL